ncbi:MAG: cation transporter [Acidimicrobiia bacterium]
MSTTSTHTVVGMTCEHCVQAVESEVARIEGVSRATAELATGRLTVESERPVDAAAVAAAVDEAGYSLA